MPKYTNPRKEEPPAAIEPGPPALYSTLTWRGQRPFIEDWLRVFTPNLRALALADWPVKTDWRVLMLCCSSIAPDSRDNRVLLTQAEMAELLKISRPACSATVKRLREAGLLFSKGHRLYVNSRLATDAHRVLDLARLRREEAKALKDMGLLED